MFDNNRVTSSPNWCHFFRLMAGGHLTCAVWTILPGDGASGAWRCRALRGDARPDPPVSHQGQTLCTALWAPFPSTSSWCIFFIREVFVDLAADAFYSHDSLCVSRHPLIHPCGVSPPGVCIQMVILSCSSGRQLSFQLSPNCSWFLVVTGMTRQDFWKRHSKDELGCVISEVSVSLSFGLFCLFCL